MVTQDFEGHALRGYRFLKSNDSQNVVGKPDIMRRAVSAFDGVELSDFENVRPFSEIHSYMDHTSKRGLTYDEFIIQILDQLGYDPKPFDEEEWREVQAHSSRKRYTEGAKYNTELLKQHATQWSVEQETADASDEDLAEADEAIEQAINLIGRAANLTGCEPGTEPEYSYDEQLQVRFNEAMELVGSIEASIHDERRRRE